MPSSAPLAAAGRGAGVDAMDVSAATEALVADGRLDGGAARRTAGVRRFRATVRRAGAAVGAGVVRAAGFGSAVLAGALRAGRCSAAAASARVLRVPCSIAAAPPPATVAAVAATAVAFIAEPLTPSTIICARTSEDAARSPSQFATDS